MARKKKLVNWDKPFTKKDYPRLRRACDVVRNTLIGPIPCEYKIAGPDKTAAAATYIPTNGWTCKIHFYDGFFARDLEFQLYTLVHEHVHVMQQPVDQVINKFDDLLPKNKRVEFWDRIYDAREIAVDRMAGMLMPMLLPRIAEVL